MRIPGTGDNNSAIGLLVYGSRDTSFIGVNNTPCKATNNCSSTGIEFYVANLTLPMFLV